MDVTADDLTKPLGLDAPPDRFRRWRVPVAPILSGLIVALLGGKNTALGESLYQGRRAKGTKPECSGKSAQDDVIGPEDRVAVLRGVHAE